MTPELEALFRALAAARKVKAEQRPIRDAAAAEFAKAATAEDKAVMAIGKYTKVKKGANLFFELDGVWWLVEKEGRTVNVQQARARGKK